MAFGDSLEPLCRLWCAASCTSACCQISGYPIPVPRGDATQLTNRSLSLRKDRSIRTWLTTAAASAPSRFTGKIVHQ